MKIFALNNYLELEKFIPLKTLKSFHSVLEESEVFKSASLKSCSHRSRRIGALSTSLDGLEEQPTKFYLFLCSVHLHLSISTPISSCLQCLFEKTQNREIVNSEVFVHLAFESGHSNLYRRNYIHFPELAQDCNYCLSCSACASQSPDPNVRVAYIRLHHLVSELWRREPCHQDKLDVVEAEPSH